MYVQCLLKIPLTNIVDSINFCQVITSTSGIGYGIYQYIFPKSL